MRRQFLKERDAFPKSAEEYAQQAMPLLRHKRAAMDSAWEELEGGWKANSERMVSLRVRPRTHEESVLQLNVGGSSVTVSWHLLAETEGFEDSILGALLEGVWGKGRIPRDADDHIVLDESPACVKHLIHTMLTGRAGSGAEGLSDSAARSAVAADEVPCLVYTANVMGLLGYVPTHPKYMNIDGGSTILEPFEMAPLSAVMMEWFGGAGRYMTLIYRATRDGFGEKSFLAKCDKSSPQTVSLFRVSSGQGNDGNDSVVGGYTGSHWGGRDGSQQEGTVSVFMLKDGNATQNDLCKATEWRPQVHQSFVSPRSDGPFFGPTDLVTIFDEVSGSCTIQTEKHVFRPAPSFLALNGKNVVDIEVYRCSNSAPPTTAIAPSPTKLGGNAWTDAEARDIRSLGESIASSFMEEQVVLDRAVKEMEAAGARVSAAVGALQTVYGPSVAAGEQDSVVDLNVRGTRMTTLRSTLQACPRSALAAMFDADRWPATVKDKDEQGRRLIDCDATCFSKILDVLRMRKRASWSWHPTLEKQWEEEKEEGEKESGIVLRGGVFIKEADAEEFGEAVNMYFPGCESFIMDLVEPV